nr:tetratricopeptide repeat protein [uncultured Caldimonas sp.]
MDRNQIDLSPFFARARAFASQGRFEDAVALYGDILQADPNNPLVYADRGTVYAMMKQFDLALQDLNQAFDLGYSDPSVYCTAATVYFEKDELQSALHYFDESIKSKPDHALAYYNRSSVLHRQGKISLAVSDLETCLSLGPDENFRKLIESRLKLLRG